MHPAPLVVAAVMAVAGCVALPASERDVEPDEPRIHLDSHAAGAWFFNVTGADEATAERGLEGLGPVSRVGHTQWFVPIEGGNVMELTRVGGSEWHLTVHVHERLHEPPRTPEQERVHEQQVLARAQHLAPPLVERFERATGWVHDGGPVWWTYWVS